MQKHQHAGGFPGFVILLAVLAGLAGPALAQNVQFIQTSDPVGIVDQTSFPPLGSAVTTVAAPTLTGGYEFAYWTINGARANDLLGVAANPVALTANAPIAAVAHYLPAAQDWNNSGISDALKLYYFGTTNITANSDPVGDGFTVAQKLHWGWNPAAFNMVEPGGISRRRAASMVVVAGFIGPRENLGGISRRRSPVLTVVLNTAYARFNQVSDPPGVLSVNQVVPKGSTLNLSLVPLSVLGYQFTGWLTNGVRVDSPAQNQPYQIMIGQDTTAIARYILATADTLGTGVPDWVEWYNFNNIGFTTNSDPVGDGLTLGLKLFRGYSLTTSHELAPGGISRRRSVVTSVILNPNWVQLNQVSDPPGVVSTNQIVMRGSTVALTVVPVSINGYQFTGWLTNGARVDSPAQNQPISLAVTQNTTVVARYILATADTLGVGIPDWMEWYNFNAIGFTTNSDPVGDGLTLGLKLFRGYSLAARHELETGGISRRRSPGTTAVLNSNFVRLVQISEPPGVISASQIVAKGSTVNLSVAPANAYGSQFTGWLVDGTRVDSPLQLQPVPITVNRDTTVIARYIPASADTLGVGIPDWLEWFNFNQVGYTLDSDPDGDGLTLGMELFRGYPLAAHDELGTGGISRRRSLTTPVNYFRVAPPVAITGAAGQIGDTFATLNGLVNPNSLQATAYFEYGQSASYDGSSPVQILGSGTNLVGCHQMISGLEPGGLYHFRVVSSSKSGVAYGDDQTFTTDFAPFTLQAVTQPDGTAAFAWTAITGNVYQVQYSTNLTDANWFNLGAVFTATNHTMIFSEPALDAQRFYRVMLPH